MPRPDPRAPGDDQESMFPEVPRTRAIVRGRHSIAVDKAIAARREKDALTDEDEAALTIVRSGAWALDQFEQSNKPYGPAKLADPMLNALNSLHMTPESRRIAEAAGDKATAELTEFLRDLATPTPPLPDRA